MSNYDNNQTDFEAWQDMWDEMQASNKPPAVEKKKQKSSGYVPDNSSLDPQDAYYGYLDSEENFQDNEDDPFAMYSDEELESLLQEDHIPNPVYPDSVGPDSAGPKPHWVNEKLLKEIESLKNGSRQKME